MFFCGMAGVWGGARERGGCVGGKFFVFVFLCFLSAFMEGGLVLNLGSFLRQPTNIHGRSKE